HEKKMDKSWSRDALIIRFICVHTAQACVKHLSRPEHRLEHHAIDRLLWTKDTKPDGARHEDRGNRAVPREHVLHPAIHFSWRYASFAGGVRAIGAAPRAEGGRPAFVRPRLSPSIA